MRRSRISWEDDQNAIAGRIARIRGSTAAQPRVPGTGEALMVLVHARAAIRRREAVLALLADPEADDRDAIGEASQGVLALYLAVAAAQQYTLVTGDATSIGSGDLANLAKTVGHMRDLVMHWEGKAKREPATMIHVSQTEIVAIAPHRRAGPTAAAGISWSWFGSAADRLATWAQLVFQDLEDRSRASSAGVD